MREPESPPPPGDAQVGGLDRILGVRVVRCGPDEVVRR
jgi:hypothetical protein